MIDSTCPRCGAAARSHVYPNGEFYYECGRSSVDGNVTTSGWDWRVCRIPELERNLAGIMGVVQTTIQPPGSPPPGGPVDHVRWCCQTIVERLAAANKAVIVANRHLHFIYEWECLTPETTKRIEEYLS